MKTVILAGGFGARLSEMTDTIPKPMIEVGGKPLLWHIINIFSAQGFNEFIIALGYKSEVIKQYFMDYVKLQSDLTVDLSSNSVLVSPKKQENWKIELIDTGDNTMTGGRLKRLKPYLNDRFFFTYGDGLANVDLKALLKSHEENKKLATVTAVSPPSKFGVLKINGNEVENFQEKPGQEEIWVNGGYFVLEPDVFEYIAGDDTSWEREPCIQLSHEKKMGVYKHNGYWQCVDTLHELRGLRKIWETGNAPWKIW